MSKTMLLPLVIGLASATACISDEPELATDEHEAIGYTLLGQMGVCFGSAEGWAHHDDYYFEQARDNAINCWNAQWAACASAGGVAFQRAVSGFNTLAETQVSYLDGQTVPVKTMYGAKFPNLSNTYLVRIDYYCAFNVISWQYSDVVCGTIPGAGRTAAELVTWLTRIRDNFATFAPGGLFYRHDAMRVLHDEALPWEVRNAAHWLLVDTAWFSILEQSAQAAGGIAPTRDGAVALADLNALIAAVSVCPVLQP